MEFTRRKLFGRKFSLLFILCLGNRGSRRIICTETGRLRETFFIPGDYGKEKGGRDFACQKRKSKQKRRERKNW